MNQPNKPESQRQPVNSETEIYGADTSPRRFDQSSTIESAQQFVGKTLGKYQIAGALGIGGMGVVFKAHDPMIERDVAIKVLSQELAADDIALRRFLAEARAAGKLNHPNVVSIYDVGHEGETFFLAMELVPGGSAADHLEQAGAYSPLEATRIVMDACQGLGAAHAVGLIHRDVKPANLLRTADGSVKVSDFGLVKSTTAETHGTTQVGQVVGTPYFMSPEQCESKAVDVRSDIYSLGASYYTLLTGKNPYEDSESAMKVMYAHCHGDIPDPRSANPGIPEACKAIVATAMAKSPEDRYQSTAEMYADLQAVAATLSGATQIALPSKSGSRAMLAGSGQSRRNLLLCLGGAAAIVTLLLVVLFLWQPWASNLGDHPPIKVGVLHSLSGTMRESESAVLNATLFAIDEINQSGGLLGRRIEAVVADGHSDPATFAAEAKRLITKDKVCVVFGCWTSASRKTVLPVFEEYDHLLVYPLQYEGLETSPNVFYMGAAPNQQILPAVRWAVEEKHCKRFFLVGSDYVFPHCANEIIKDYLKTTGAKVVGEQYLPLGDTKVEPLIEKIKSAKPDMILNTINGDTNLPFFRELRDEGIKSTDIPTLSFSIGEHELRSLNIGLMQGDYAAWTYFQSLDTPANKRFVAAFQKKHPLHAVTDPMEAAYVGVKLWAQAVKEANSTDTTKVRRAMLHQRLDAPEGPIRIDPTTQHCFKIPRVGQINDKGQFTIVWRASKAVQPIPYPSTRTARDWQAYLHDLYTGWGKHWAAPVSR